MFLAVAAIVHAVSGSKVDSELVNALAHPFVVAEVSKFNPVDARLDASSNLRGLVLDPSVKLVRVIFCYVVDCFNRAIIVAY